MEQNKQKKGLDAYLPYLIAGVLLVCVVVGAVFLLGDAGQEVQPTKPDPAEQGGQATEAPSLQQPNQGTQEPGQETEPAANGVVNPQPTTEPTASPTEPTSGGTTEPQPTTAPPTEAPTEPAPTEEDGHVHTVLLNIPEMWSDYMSRELVQLDQGTRQIFYTEVQGKRVDLFGVTFGFVDESKNGFSMGIYAAECGDRIPVAIESYQPTPGSDWTDGDKNRVNAMREEINSMIAQLRSFLVD